MSWNPQGRQEEVIGPVKWVKEDYLIAERHKCFAYLEVPNGVHVLAEYQGLFAVIRQFRPAVKGYVLELPGGGVETDEGVLEAAYREVYEEIGLVAEEGRILGSCRPSLAFSDEVTWIIHVKGQRLETQHLEWDEEIEVHWLSLGEIKRLLMEGKLQQATAYVAIWLLEQKPV